jgi:hypothetical protein
LNLQSHPCPCLPRRPSLLSPPTVVGRPSAAPTQPHNQRQIKMWRDRIRTWRVWIWRGDSLSCSGSWWNCMCDLLPCLLFDLNLGRICLLIFVIRLREVRIPTASDVRPHLV